MNNHRHIEDEDLALYAMDPLGDGETAAVAAALSHSPELRERLAQVRGWLSIYAESVEPTPVPEGSLERLLNRIAAQKKITEGKDQVLAFSAPLPQTSKRNTTLLAWTGWAVAAGLALTAGELYHQHRSTPEPMASQPAPPTQVPFVPTELIHERDALKASVDAQAKQIEQLTAHTAKTTKEATGLRASLAGQATKLKGQAAQVAEAQAEQEALRGTVESQAEQVARLTNDAGNAHQILEALTDPTALRVTLTKPNSRPAPTGRATYVANKGTLVFLASNLDRLKAGKVYQLWLMPTDGSQPVPAGTFAPDVRGNASVVYARFIDAVAAKGFAVTIEDQGGSQTPTLPILLAGSASL